MTPTEATQALLPVTQADRNLVFGLLMPAARTLLQKLALEYIRDGKSDDADAVQQVARHRQSLPGDVGMRGAAQAVLDSACRPGSRMLLGDESTDDSWIDYREVGQVELDALAAALTPSALSGDAEQSSRIYRMFQVYRSQVEGDQFAEICPGWIGARVAILGYEKQGFRVCAQPGGETIGSGDWGDFIVEYADGSLGVRAALPSHQGAGEP